MTTDPIVIVSAARTPMGDFQGAFAGAPATVLGSTAISAAIERARLTPDAVQEVFMGCVLPAGLRQAPARQASLGAGIPVAAPCTTVNKVCGSAMKSIILAHDSLLLGNADIMVAGGMESMSNAPYLLLKGRDGYRLGHDRVLDHLFFDGLEDAYEKGKLMGEFAEDCVAQYGFTREAQDDYARNSLSRAQQATLDGTFEAEIVPVTVSGRKGDTRVERDEAPFKKSIDQLAAMRPAFRKNGTVTAGNASAISDGAAATVLMRLSEAERRGIEPLAKIIGHAGHAQEPALFTTAPVFAIRKLLEKVNWSTRDVDLYEVNEAFACVAMVALKDLGLAHEKYNVHGGAVALGHPIGATGARIVVTLVHALRKYDLRRGVACLCIGGGEATALAVERL
ncbi:MAG: acetyl-CoA C-acyltransferase [Gammaproteobacteria bacterium]|nr:acetyl-CoA C-acyltransferase [Gammaproteobacteria bacterium]MCP5425462.1 acetyl-CoA C-acyltransferase [Gammaproteobacteria bacterium]MCP5459935.1 acetyl-CoA C-acyltransferase [Gammaproteobacteria bacterium]